MKQESDVGVILVTGGAGYIGSHVVQQLSKRYRQYVVFDNLDRGNQVSIPPNSLIVGDLCDTAYLGRVIKEYSVTSIIHFAALAYVRESREQPALYWRNNIGGTLSLMEATRGTDVRNFVFSSSCATYGIPDKLPIAVSAPQRPINPYGWTKLACERMIQDYALEFGLRSIILRYFNVAGSDPDGGIGETHDPETHLIPSILLRAHEAGASLLEIYGDDYPTSDGSCVRDYIHVVDLARVHVKALERLESGCPSGIYNVGLGRGTGNFQIRSLCEEVTGRPIPFVVKPRNPGDPPVLIADPGETWSVFGLEPRYPAVKQMIEHSWRWISSGKRDEWLASRAFRASSTA